MSAQGGTITGRSPVQLPIRSIVLILAAITAAVIGISAIRLADRDAGVEPAVSAVEGYWNPTTGHPALRARNGEGEASMPVQRVYPNGFGARAEEETSMPVQRVYPDGFSQPVDDGQTPVFDGRRRKW
jgi:hypothetical protein